MELLKEYFDIWYLIIIVLGGKLITDERLMFSKPFWLKAFLSRIDAAWKVLFLSAVVGVVLYQLEANVDAKKLIATFLFANSFYALVIKYVFAWIEGMLPKKDA